MTQSEVAADRLYGEASLLAFIESLDVNLPQPQQFNEEDDEEIIFADAPQEAQEQRLSKHELEAIEKGISLYLNFDCYFLNKRDLNAKIHLALEKGMSKEHIPWILKTSKKVRNMEAARRSRKKGEEEIRELKEKIQFTRQRKEELLKINEEENLKKDELYNQWQFMRKFYKAQISSS